MIAMQSTDRRAPVPPNRLSPPGVPPEQRQDADQRAGNRSTQFEQLLARLEEGYEFHTMQLTRLYAQPADSAGALERDSLASASRQALSQIAAALRDMAEGRYGTCSSCRQPIPGDRLEARPEARHCLRCQAASTG